MVPAHLRQAVAREGWNAGQQEIAERSERIEIAPRIQALRRGDGLGR
jgi:hypothetical protein